MSQGPGCVPGHFLLAYQAFSQHIHGRAGLPQGLLGQGLGLSSGSSSGSLADISVTLFRLQGGRRRLLPRGGKGPLVVGHSRELRERKGVAELARLPACRHHVYTAGLLLRTTADASDQNNLYDRIQLKT